MHGETFIDSYQKVNMFQTCINFYELKELGEYDAVLGMSALSQIRGRIDISRCRLFHEFGEETLNCNKNDQLNVLINVNEKTNVEVKRKLKEILSKYQGAYFKNFYLIIPV